MNYKRLNTEEKIIIFAKAKKTTDILNALSLVMFIISLITFNFLAIQLLLLITLPIIGLKTLWKYYKIINVEIKSDSSSPNMLFTILLCPLSLSVQSSYLSIEENNYLWIPIILVFIAGCYFLFRKINIWHEFELSANKDMGDILKNEGKFFTVIIASIISIAYSIGLVRTICFIIINGIPLLEKLINNTF